MAKKTPQSPSRAPGANPAGAFATKLQAALALHRAGRLIEAESAYRLLLLTEPNHAEIARLLGLIAMGRGEFPKAAGFFERAVRSRPEFVEAHVELGKAFSAQGKWTEAEAACHLALTLDPNQLEALNTLGNVLQARRRFAEAAAVFRQALALDPVRAELHNNLGNALQAEKKPDEAIAAYRAAIALKPDFPEAHSNLANVLKAENRLPEALLSYRRALELNPRYVDALTNMGNALHAHGQPAEAIAAYRRSQELQPAQGDAYFYESLVQLALGHLPEGFAEYEYRWRSDLKLARRGFPQPVWLGEPGLTGKVILLHAEQGLGDTLQFARYAPLVAARGAKVLLEVQPALKPLLHGLPGVEAVIAKGDPLPAFDLHCPLLSLPHAFRTTLENIPARVPYLTASPERVSRWRDRLASGLRPRVGLTWAGNPHHKNDRNRSLALRLLQPALDRANGSFYSLQKEYRSSEERELAAAMGIADLSSELENFDDTAALVTQLDLVISVDTSTAHLAGALGVPTWVLLPFAPDWRWLLQRADSPWYPGMRLFRQERAGDWTKPLEAVGTALAGWTAG